MIKFQEMTGIERLLFYSAFAISKIPYWVALSIFILYGNITLPATATTIITIFISKLYVESILTRKSIFKNISESIVSSLITILKSMVLLLLLYIYLFLSTDIEKAIILTIAIIYIYYFYNIKKFQDSMYIGIISSTLWIILIFFSDQTIWNLVIMFAIYLLETYHLIYNRLRSNLA